MNTLLIHLLTKECIVAPNDSLTSQRLSPDDIHEFCRHHVNHLGEEPRRARFVQIKSSHYVLMRRTRTSVSECRCQQTDSYCIHDILHYIYTAYQT